MDKPVTARLKQHFYLARRRSCLKYQGVHEDKVFISGLLMAPLRSQTGPRSGRGSLLDLSQRHRTIEDLQGEGCGVYADLDWVGI
jgi:phage protein U